MGEGQRRRHPQQGRPAPAPERPEGGRGADVCRTASINAQGGWDKFKSFRDTWDFFGSGNQVAEDQVGAWPMEQWYYNVLAGSSPKVHITALPFRNRKRRPINYRPARAWAIPKGSKNAAAACTWMKTMTSVVDVGAPRQRTASRSAGRRTSPITGISTGNAVADQAIYKTVCEDQPVRSTRRSRRSLDVQRYSFSIPASPAGAEFKQAWMDAVTASSPGQQSPKQALDQAQKEAVDGDQGRNEVRRDVGPASVATCRDTRSAGPSHEGPALGVRLPGAGHVGGLRVPHPVALRLRRLHGRADDREPRSSRSPTTRSSRRRTASALRTTTRSTTTRRSRTALRNTLVFTLLDVPAHMIVALALASVLVRVGRAAGFFRTIFYLPVMTPGVAIGILYLLIFNGSYGVLNQGLALPAYPGPFWTTDPHWVKPGLALMISIWGVGGERRHLPRRAHGRAEAPLRSGRDGRRRSWRRFRDVTLPMISPAHLLHRHHPHDRRASDVRPGLHRVLQPSRRRTGRTPSLMYAIYIFQQAFTFFKFGYASALAWVLFVIIGIITVIQIVVSRRFVYYEGSAKR